MDIFPLPLFPQGSLASSVITTVWIGVAVVAFFNLRLGWVLSGLVVPGYIVPLLIVKPWAAAVVSIEGVVTYLLVWLFSERLSRLGFWFNFFGRDRFFALILASVAVRVGFDGWLWPVLGMWVNDYFGINFDYRNNLQSFGLIIIALIANQFWKTGLIRGLVPMAVTVGLTYLLVRYGLMELTNFTISNVGYMYEDIASSILASPKAYIILIVAALVASRMNLLYGWDFSGILIPSLLALQWYQPGKILTSFAEALLILWVARLLLRTSLFRNANIEGARKLLLFFNIGFVYKIFLSYLVIWLFPEMKVTDTYAFGYLLATLLALKMHDKDIAARMTRATLQTSLSGVMLASLVGFCLTLLPTGPGSGSGYSAFQASVIHQPEDRLIQRLREDKVHFYASYRGQVPVPLAAEVERFDTAFSDLKRYRSERNDTLLNEAATRLGMLGFTVELLEDKYLYITEEDFSRGWGVYVINLENPDGLLIEVPAPLDEPGTLESGMELFRLLEAGALAVGGSRRSANPDQSADVLRNPQTVYNQFHRVMSSHNVLQVRAYTAQLARELYGLRADEADVDRSILETRLWVKSALPPGLDLRELREHTGQMDILWETSPFPNRQRDTVRHGFTELLLSRESVRRIRAHAVTADITPHLEIQDQRIDGYLQEWVLTGKQLIATRGSDAYVVPGVDELLFFDEEVLTPLLRTIVSTYAGSEWPDEAKQTLQSVQASAAVVGYRLMQYRHRQSSQEFLVLYEPEESARRRYWGTYVIRLGAADPYLIQVPRPLHEINSFEYAVSLFERLNGRALLIAGAHPDANRDGSSDLVRRENLRSLFSLVNQVLLRESGDTPMMAIHSRARGYRSGIPVLPEDALLSARRDLAVEIGEDALSRKFLDTLRSDGLSYRFVDGSPATAGYEVDGVPQSQYLSATSNKQFWAVWLSPTARSNYRQQAENRQEVARFNALGIQTIEDDLYAGLKQGVITAPEKGVPGALRADIRRYLAGQDIVSLRRLQRVWADYSFKRLLDRDSRQSFLVVLENGGAPLLVANLNPRQLDAEVHWSISHADRSTVLDYINQRSAWLILEYGT